MEDLKACPFCGQKPKIIYEVKFDDFHDYLRTIIICTPCDIKRSVSTAVDFDEDDVIKKWTEGRNMAISKWNERSEK